ncbi:MarR family winged helix-turn-helix transcriptional regulator [Hominifimenecus sp. rT4P-3]|uniref:MarR family winged helix-turn-helix transcriptional regulator n=1 Tax=Hominifimenecus sp. rT4P-3 TaxID=3242979 RepID=UPI003DA5FEE2
MDQIKDKELASLFFDVFSDFMLTLKKSASSEAELKMNSHTFFVLFTLTHEKEKPITMTMLAEALQISKQQLTKLVNDLEGRNYVERIHDQVNRRLVYIRITKAGQRRMDEFSEAALKPVTETLRLYSREEKEKLAEDFAGLTKFLKEVRGRNL